MDHIKKILIIDDEEKLIFGLKAILRREGWDVVVARNGMEGLESARSQSPDMIICDVMMPPPNGFELKKLLERDIKTAIIPFIFLTARTATADLKAGMNVGADVYMTKPFDVDELLAQIKAIFRREEIGRMQGLSESSAAIDQLRTSIATNLGHELRTPLGIIMNSLDLAIREKNQSSPTDIEWCLKNAQSSAWRLNSLVNDLITLNEIDQNSISTFRFVSDLRFEFFAPIQKTLELYADKNLSLKIVVDPETTIHSPQPQFSHCIYHLIDNACKFSPQGGQIRIRLVKNGVGGCILTIEDDGIGIPPELREKVFERYFQEEQGNTRTYGGLGIGLTIVRAIIEKLGGTIKLLDSETGSKIRLVLPPAPVNWMVAQRNENTLVDQVEY